MPARLGPHSRHSSMDAFFTGAGGGRGSFYETVATRKRTFTLHYNILIYFLVPLLVVPITIAPAVDSVFHVPGRGDFLF